jgi:ribosomal protein S18 acetylase RimI-like enzyme
MNIEDFLPKYPNIHQSYPVLNPYSDFYQSIYRKKEFYENKLDKAEVFPRERGMLTKHQKIIARYMSSRTPYDRVLLVHSMGTGKCVLPNTVIKLNVGTMRIEDLWNKYYTRIQYDEEGQWSYPSDQLYVKSYCNTKQTICDGFVKMLYKQEISEPVRKIVTQNRSITCTKKHRLYTATGWSNDISTNSLIAIIIGNQIVFEKVLSVIEFNYTGYVYDLEVENYHNYEANGILTHNTCSAIGAIEQIREEESTFDGAIILAKGGPILDNFLRELVEKCTDGRYMPENYNKLKDLEKIHRVKKATKFYELRTFIKFKKQIKKMSDDEIVKHFSNKIIVIDEVHNLRIQDQEKDSMDTYEQYYRFLHLIKNAKVILLSGTPMKDKPEEIASVANLILPIEEKLPTGEEFIEEYMNSKGNVYTLKKEKIGELKNKLKGRISFLRETYSSVTKEYIGEPIVGNLKHLIVAPNKMSKFQSKYYTMAREKDKAGKTGVYANSKEATLFVYPDGSYGKEGFDKYIKLEKQKVISLDGNKQQIASYRLSKELRVAIKGETDEETLANIRTSSATYAEVIEQILNTDGNCFVYSSLVQGSGAIVFSLLLELFGFSKANGKEKDKSLRYALLTNKVVTTTEIRKIIDRYNRPDNMKGHYIKVIIGSRAISEGFSFRNVVFESVNTPHWNYSETTQALARGIRLGSHKDLIENGESPIVKILQPVSIPKNGESLDLLMYETSEDKDISIHNILRMLMEVAFDCALNYFRNRVDGKDGSRDCDYTTCNYGCDDVNMDIIKQGLDDSEIDYSTYQLYYANPKIPTIKRKIEQLFRVNNTIDMDSIIKNLKKDFTEDEIKNALFTLQEETDGTMLKYKDFLELYTHSPVKKIMNEIEQLFSRHFRLDINSILEQFDKETHFDVLTALRTIINESVVITNKYGLPCYIREENNVFFLVNNLTINPTFFSEYYSRLPHINTMLSFKDIMERINDITLPSLINKICNTQNDKDFTNLMKTLPKSIQEIFIEASLVADDMKLKHNKNLRKRVLEYFKSYIKKVDNTWVSTLLQEDNILRCGEENNNVEDWKNCDDNYKDIIQEKEAERMENMRKDNPYGIIGLYNPINSAFCIVDFQKEESDKTKRKKSSDDKRLNHSGKVCSSWKLPDLINIVVNRLKIEPPDGFKNNVSKSDLYNDVKQDEKIASIFDNLEEVDTSTLRRALYWGKPKKDGGNKGIKNICDAMRKWLEDRNLLEIDDKCGIQGKKKVNTVTQGPKKDFTLIELVPTKDKQFTDYTEHISKLMDECFGVKKYKPDINDYKWVMIFSKSKLVAFMVIDSKDVIWNVCVAKNYRRQGIAKEAMRLATEQLCEQGKNPKLLVDNIGPTFKKLVKMYTSFGFVIDSADGRYTYMSYPCE